MKRLVKKAQIDLNDPKFAEIKALIDENNRFENDIKTASEPYYAWIKEIDLRGLMGKMTQEQLKTFDDQIESSSISFTSYRMLEENKKFGNGLDQDINQLASEHNQKFKPYQDVLEAHAQWLGSKGNEKKVQKLVKQFSKEEIEGLAETTEGNLKFKLYLAASQKK